MQHPRLLTKFAYITVLIGTAVKNDLTTEDECPYESRYSARNEEDSSYFSVLGEEKDTYKMSNNDQPQYF